MFRVQTQTPKNNVRTLVPWCLLYRDRRNYYSVLIKCAQLNDSLYFFSFKLKIWFNWFSAISVSKSRQRQVSSWSILKHTRVLVILYTPLHVTTCWLMGRRSLWDAAYGRHLTEKQAGKWWRVHQQGHHLSCLVVVKLKWLYTMSNVYLKGQYHHNQSRLSTRHGIGVLV